jgi:hypothetical protein
VERLFDVVYYYHHPDEAPTPTQETDRGGFYHPFELVSAGWVEWKRTGVLPDPEDLARRLNRRWTGDLEYFDSLIESGRPKPPPDDENQ